MIKHKNATLTLSQVKVGEKMINRMQFFLHNLVFLKTPYDKIGRAMTTEIKILTVESLSQKLTPCQY